MRGKIVLCAAVCFCFGIVFSVEAQRPGKRTGTAKKVNRAEQNTEAVPNTGGNVFLVKGIVADAKGPLGNKTVIVMPLDASGQPVTRQPGANATLRLDGRKPANSEKWSYYYTIISDSRLGSMLNPRTTTNARGAFSVRVPRELFNDPPGCVTCTGYKAGEIGLGVFTGNVSHFEIEKIKFDEKASTVDLGRVVFKPVHVPEREESVRRSTISVQNLQAVTHRGR